MNKAAVEPKYGSLSVVMAVYERDRPEWLVQAIESILGQTFRSDDFIVVADGPLTKELDSVVRKYVKSKAIKVVRLDTNQGLGSALNAGIKIAKNELIARMDADDIAVENRFELQLAEFNSNESLDILGGQIAEFIDDPHKIISYRNVPVSMADIAQFSRRRSPFNHPTVMYKKSAIQKLGGYDPTAIRIEDYDLWLRAIAAGLKCRNLNIVLLKYRSTADALKRRKTLVSLKSHIRARVGFYSKSYIAFSDLVYGVTTQLLLFATPTRVAAVFFKKAVRNVEA